MTTRPTKRRELELCLRVRLRETGRNHCSLQTAEEIISDTIRERPYLFGTYSGMTDRAFALMVATTNKELNR